MKRTLALALALTGTVLAVHPAQGQVRQGGYDEATRQLEEGFKIVSTQRVFADDECYPDPDEIAAELRRAMEIEVVVSPSLESVQGLGLVNVVSGETECNRLVLAIRAGAKGRLFVLDSDYGPVYVQGGGGLSQESVAGGVGPLRDLTAATATVSMHRADEKSRFEVHCPGGTAPLGGGWFNLKPVDADGAALYPHSYERLGVQSGFHVTSVYVDRSNRASSPVRRAQMQVLCGRGLVPTASPHETTFVPRQGTGSVTARCPEGTQLFSGGFQRTNFLTPGVATNGVFYGGDYVTESRAVGNAWRVSGGAADRYGGELTAIAYCAEDRSLPVEEVSTTVSVGEGRAAAATTPRCPEGRALIAGGFSFGGSHDALFADGYFTRKDRWSATGYGWFGSAELTAYGYCAEARDTVDRAAFPKEPPPGPAPEEDDGNTLLYVGLGAIALVIVALFLRRRQVVRRRARRQPARSTRPS
jgi:hypothetical protein